MSFPDILLEVRDLSCAKDKGDYIFHKVCFEVREGNVLVLQGRSGSGKSTLLKSLAHLNVYDGEILYRGKPPKFYGIPCYRTCILYVPQKPSLLPGTPRDFLTTVVSFSSRQSSKLPPPDLQRPIDLSQAWGIEEELWDRNWANLSGGEAQRIALATAVGLDSAEVLLLDEPTSALDSQSSSLVESHLLSALRSPESTLKAIVWITHSEEQGHRVGTRFIRLSGGEAHEDAVLA